MIDRLTRDKPDGSKLSVEVILSNAYEKDDKDVLLIKVVDRLHNMETIKAIKPAKRERTSEQTFQHFIPASIFLEILKIEEQIFTISCKNIKQNTSNSLSYFSLKYKDPYQLLSQVYKNDSNLYRNLHK